MLNCPKCTSDNFVKAGFISENQRYKCKKCGYFFTKKCLGYDIEIKIKAIRMFREGLGFRSIGRLLDVSFQSVANWVRNFGKILKENVKIESDFDVVEVDEMWHYVKKNSKNCGFGLLLIQSESKFLVFKLADADLRLQKSSL